MLHFVINDADPEKLSKPKSLLKILNDNVLLISTANGPLISHKNLVLNENQLDLSANENGYKAVFKGEGTLDALKSGKFVLYEEDALVFEFSFTINDALPSAIRVKISNEGERLIKQELEREFERDISFEAAQFIAHGDSAANPKLESLKSEMVTDDQLGDEVLSEAQNDADKAEGEATDSEEIKLEFEDLPETFTAQLSDAKSILSSHHNLVHDLFRGAVGDFSSSEMGEDTIENGAIIQFVDYSFEEYTVTFRHGSLSDVIEASFFLETDEGVILSTHFSSLGHGYVTAQTETIAQKAKSFLLD